ncbi:LysR family transcriptional regulator [Klebsiella variicola subsp. variicola]|nr:LysR family transcriptional regulator [Klebsiella variicola subsp. variicola]
MTPKQLEVFISIVQLGSVTAAAAQLAMSQPSVSKSLALIEQQMGFSLFERYQGKMQPTAEARALYKEALRVHQDRLRFERFVDHIRQYRVGQLRVCATPALALNILPLAVARFRQTFPDYGVVADMCLNNEIETAVEEGRYDLGFSGETRLRTRGRTRWPSAGAKWCVCCPGSIRWRSRRKSIGRISRRATWCISRPTRGWLP